LYKIIDASGYAQCLWPVPYFIDTHGAKLLSWFRVRPHNVIVKRESNHIVDSYSCFFDVMKPSSIDAH
jgi:hypothetical protein